MQARIRGVLRALRATNGARIASAIMRASEQAAVAEGFTRLELRSTLTGIALYRAHGFVEVEATEIPLPAGGSLPAAQMVKILRAPRVRP